MQRLARQREVIETSYFRLFQTLLSSIRHSGVIPESDGDDSIEEKDLARPFSRIKPGWLVRSGAWPRRVFEAGSWAPRCAKACMAYNLIPSIIRI